MNVILVVADTLRRDFLGCYGNPWIHTPYLDRLAREAVVFDRAYSASFPTHALPQRPLHRPLDVHIQGVGAARRRRGGAGRGPERRGLRDGSLRGYPPPLLPGYNYQRGFQGWELIRGQEADPWRTTPAEVRLPCSPEKLRGGAGPTEQYLRNVAWRRSEEDYFPARTMRAAAMWLEENRGRPFFLYVDTFDPHEPWDPPAHYLARYEPEGYGGESVIYPRYERWAEFLTEAELRHCRNLYAGEVSLMDRWVGYLLERAEDLGLLPDTAVIFMSDHGFYLGEHGYVGKALIREGRTQPLPLYPELTRVPLLVRPPGGMGARRSDAFAQPVDVMPTVLELVGVAAPGTARGRSLVPTLSGDDGVRPFAVSAPALRQRDTAAPHAMDRLTVTTPEWAFVFGPQTEETPDDGSATSFTVFEGSLAPELYHLPSDPGCTRNVLTEHRDVGRRLQDQLVTFLRDSGMSEEYLPVYAAPPSELRE